MSRPNRLLLVFSVTVTVVLMVVAIGAAAYYYSSADTISSKDATILGLRAQLLSQNVTSLKLELKLAELDINITVLQKEVADMAANQTLSAARASLLSQEVLSRENQSAFLSTELAVAQRVGGFSVVTYLSNKTVLVGPGSTVDVADQANGHNGTLAFVSLAGCPASGDRVQESSSHYGLYLLLNSSGTLLRSDFRTVGTEPFSVYLQNVGPEPMLCTFSLLYAQQ